MAELVTMHWEYVDADGESDLMFGFYDPDLETREEAIVRIEACAAKGEKAALRP